jgi:hypothetical protein
MTEHEAPIEDRDANVRLVISNLMSTAQDKLFEQFDHLHRRNITDEDILLALRNMGEEDLRDDYAEWADIDIREDDNTTLNPAVPDPGNAPSYSALESALKAEIREDADLTGEWTNGKATIELTTLHMDRGLIGAVWNAVQKDAVFGGRHLVITPAGLRDAGYRRVTA